MPSEAWLSFALCSMDCKACQKYVSLVSAQQQELLLFQQHAGDLVAAATAEINVCHDELDREQEEHEKTKAEVETSNAELAKLQGQLARLLPSLQSLSQQLKVRTVAVVLLRMTVPCAAVLVSSNS